MQEGLLRGWEASWWPELRPGRRGGPAPPGAPHPPADAPLLAASALRTPISITSSYAAPFAMMSHHEMNGSLTSPSAYASLHNIPPQMSAAAAAAAAAYGRSPMVSFGAVRRPFGSFCWRGGDWERSGDLVGVVRQLPLGQCLLEKERNISFGVSRPSPIWLVSRQKTSCNSGSPLPMSRPSFSIWKVGLLSFSGLRGDGNPKSPMTST